MQLADCLHAAQTSLSHSQKVQWEFKSRTQKTPNGVELLQRFAQAMSRWHHGAALQNNPPHSPDPQHPGIPNKRHSLSHSAQAENKAACPLCEQDAAPSFQPVLLQPSLPPISAVHTAHRTRSIPELCSHCSSPHIPKLLPTASHTWSTITAALITPNTHQPRLSPPRLRKAQPFLSVPSQPAGKCSLPGPDADYSSRQHQMLGRHMEPNSHRATRNPAGRPRQLGRNAFGSAMAVMAAGKMPQRHLLLGSAH